MFCYLDYNSLTGTVPTELGMLSGVYELCLSKNSLTARCPRSWGSCQGFSTYYYKTTPWKAACPHSWERFQTPELSWTATPTYVG
ncbi:hypothetical protein CYMTET_6926 [Cymbomonas tetramitiformis]|uniref:Uncharacterized protein n=1 Tax=Cymbomonas tetramitiformis TaxID=36881 RepID=A0AAE0GWH1_9CHLO|nr:hypothetical protein CYMTET_6926 [Cymbomonas tetramitiformis]